jgi:hypothetical protein
VLGLGEETGGSIQNPAATQALVGIKPTFGLVPNTGVVPLGDSTRDVIGREMHAMRQLPWTHLLATRQQIPRPLRPSGIFLAKATPRSGRAQACEASASGCTVPAGSPLRYRRKRVAWVSKIRAMGPEIGSEGGSGIGLGLLLSTCISCALFVAVLICRRPLRHGAESSTHNA